MSTIIFAFVCSFWLSAKGNEAIQVSTQGYIKWVSFDISQKALTYVMELDIKSQDKSVKIDFVETLSYLGAKYGGNFNSYKQKDVDALVKRLNNGESMQDITANMKLYKFYKEAYGAVLKQFLGSYQIKAKDKNGKIGRAHV